MTSFIFTPLGILFIISMALKRTLGLREATRAAQIPSKGSKWDLNPLAQVPGLLAINYTTYLFSSENPDPTQQNLEHISSVHSQGHCRNYAGATAGPGFCRGIPLVPRLFSVHQQSTFAVNKNFPRIHHYPGKGRDPQ